MTLEVHRPYPGVALAVTEKGSVLFGAPADAFKATKRYCSENNVPFPRTLVAPKNLLAGVNPQFAPEFFLYDFLFVYGAAFKPELAGERLQLVVDPSQAAEEKQALELTLNGPSRAEMAGYKNDKGQSILTADTVKALADVSEYMAIKKDGLPRQVEDMTEILTFDGQGGIELLEGALEVQRDDTGFRVKSGQRSEYINLTFDLPVVPFATLPIPKVTQTPLTFGFKPLGTRSGFDLTGPTTGFLIWVNGRAVIYDGPVGTRYLLQQQGIALNDVDAVILSHCHEDHMGAFTELILSGHKPKVLTAEPIYRSMLAKLSRYFKMTEEQVAGFVDYQRITPGESVDVLGATFDFFYTVHAIPTIGMSVRMQSPGGQHHSVQISGDTMHHEGLDKMHADGVLTRERYESMRHLVPDAKVDGAWYLADVGEAIIHGHPKDWQGNPNRVLYYHCPDNEHTRSFGHELAGPAQVYPLIEPGRIHPAVPGRLLTALSFLDFKDPAWLANILYRGRTRKVDAGETLGNPDDPEQRRVFSVIVSGSADVGKPGEKPFTSLGPGEFFGCIELVDEDGKHTATITATSPMELFDIDGALLMEYLQTSGDDAVMDKVWHQRPMVDTVKVFRQLDIPTRDRLAAVGSSESHKPGSIIIKEGSKGDEFYLLAEGEVEISVGGNVVRRLTPEDEDNFFGEIAAIYPNRPRSAQVKALTPVTLLCVRGPQVRSLFEGHMDIRYAMVVAIRDRGGDKK